MSPRVKLCLLLIDDSCFADSASPGPPRSMVTVSDRPTLPAVGSKVHACREGKYINSAIQFMYTIC